MENTRTTAAHPDHALVQCVDSTLTQQPRIAEAASAKNQMAVDKKACEVR